MTERKGSALAGCLISFFIFAATFAVAVLLSGCAEFSVVKSGVATHGAKIADENLDVAVWSICNAQTVGAWVRRYGTDETKSEAWRILCGYPDKP